MNLKFRDATQKDIAFITSTWLNALWSSKNYKSMKKTVFMQNHHDAIKKRMGKFSCTIACNPDDPYVIYGYIIFNEPSTIQFAYVKGTFRGLGICKKMINEAFKKEMRAFEITHITEYTRDIGKTYDLNYNPYAFFEVV